MSDWSGYGSFATRNAAGIVRILEVTGYNTYSEFMTDTTHYDRELIVEAIREQADHRAG